MFFFGVKITKIIKCKHKDNVKTFSLRLNTRPYNKLDKKAVDFKEYKGGLIELYNTKCFYLGTRTL